MANTFLSTFKFLDNFLKVNSWLTDLIIFFLFFQKRSVDRRMFSYYLPFLKVSEKNIYYYGQKPRESDVAQMISKTCP